MSDLLVLLPVEPGISNLNPEVATRELRLKVKELTVAVLELQHSFFTATHVVPAKPRDGMIRRADGTNWDPGDGEGIYQRLAGTWRKLSPAAAANFLDFAEIAVPANPAANTKRLFLSSATGKFSLVDSTGAITDLELGNIDKWDTP